MRSIRRTLIIRSYLAVSLAGWLIFGVLLRAQLDLIGAAETDLIGLALLALFGVLVLFGTPIGYLVLNIAMWRDEPRTHH